MLIKGTRMIVITRKKLIYAGCIAALFGVCACLIGAAPWKKDITAFSDYEKIIDSELTPAADKSVGDTVKNVTEKASKLPQSMLRHFFVFGDEKPAPSAEPTPEATAEPTQQPEMMQAESRRADKGLQVSNASGINVNPSDFINLPLAFGLDANGPQVLIMHTHTTESYSEENYIKGAPDRNLDETKNITVVGEAMAEVFRNNGIETVHDTTVHDYPAYNGSYKRAAATIQNNLNKYGGIKVVLDVHRDGITKADGTKVKLMSEINGIPTAQVMLVVGTNATLKHDSWQENFKFASHIQAKAIELYPSLMRPIDIRQERFNEHMTTGSLIVEIGTNGNTMQEAVNGGKCVAEAIAAVLKNK